MDRIKLFFSSIKWYEYVFSIVCFSIYLFFGIFFKANVVVMINVLLGFLMSLFFSKGNVASQIVGIIQLPFYATVVFRNRYYGEFILVFLILLPMYIYGVVTWFKNLNKRNGEVKIIKKIGWQEWIIATLVAFCLGVGVFCLLRYFNTYQLLLSTFSFVLCSFAKYFVIRRCEYGFIFYVLSNATCLIMWLMVAIDTHNLSQIVMFFNYIVYIFLNIVGIFNFIRLKREQNRDSYAIIMKILKE